MVGAVALMENLMNRYIFTDNRPTLWEQVRDYALAAVLGIVFAVLALAYFDVLTK